MNKELAWWDVLGVNPWATRAEIVRAYKAKVAKDGATAFLNRAFSDAMDELRGGNV